MTPTDKHREEFEMCVEQLRKHVTSLPVKRNYSLHVAMEAIVRISRECGLLTSTSVPTLEV